MKSGKSKIKAGGPERSRRVVVAMSGGVDSSVAAALLKQAGFDVIGIMMKFWKDPSASSGQAGDNRCCSVESEKLARSVAKKIGILFYVLNVEKEFKEEVVDYFLKEYKKGRTPNPCIVCNKEIKFGFLIKKALSLGADFVATGHYARIQNGKLLKGADKEKDQSYFLWQLDQKQLNHVLFPVGGYTKPEVRKLAKKFKLPTAETPESQEVCFIHPHTKQEHQRNLQANGSCACYGVGVKNTTNDFLRKYLKTEPGKIIDKMGKTLGEHQGLWFYTIGQRRGLEIPQGPYYVVGKDFKKNILIVSKNQKDLNKKELIAKNVNWISGKEPKLPLKAKVKIRYRTKAADAVICKLPTTNYKLIFTKPQKAITPGQSVVFYKGRELLGGGVIE